jgi:fumarate reductase subunit D
MRKYFKHLLAGLGLCAALGMGAMALPTGVAATNFSLPTPNNTSLDGGADANRTISTLAQNVINIIFLIAGILAVIYLLWSGIQYITAGGNQDKVKAARQGIINAVIGIVVIMAAFFIIRIATSTRGIFDNNGAVNGGGTGGGGF